MLTTFGIFWTGEGLGADWPGADLSLFGIFLILAAVSLALVRGLGPAVAPSGAGAAR